MLHFLAIFRGPVLQLPPGAFQPNLFGAYEEILELTVVRHLWEVSLGMSSPCKGRDMVAPWQRDIHASDLYHPTKSMGLSSTLVPSLCCGGDALA